MRGDGSGSFPYVHVDNFVDAVMTAASTPRALDQAYNLVDGQTTGREYLDRFCRWLGQPPLVARHETASWRGRFSGAKARRELAYVPRVSYDEAMAETERSLVELGLIRR